MSYVKRLRVMLAELEAHPKIEVTEVHFHPPVDPSILADLRTRWPISDAMAAFYSEANGVIIKWELAEGAEGDLGDYEASGSVNLLPIENVFGSWQDSIWFDEEDEYRNLYPLDFYVEEACAALLVDGAEEPTVYYHYCGEEMATLKLSFEAYLELLLHSRGFWYWHKSIAAPDYFNPYVPQTHEEKQFRAVAPMLFADFDGTRFVRTDGYTPEPKVEEELPSIPAVTAEKVQEAKKPWWRFW